MIQQLVVALLVMLLPRAAARASGQGLRCRGRVETDPQRAGVVGRLNLELGRIEVRSYSFALMPGCEGYLRACGGRGRESSLSMQPTRCCGQRGLLADRVFRRPRVRS